MRRSELAKAEDPSGSGKLSPPTKPVPAVRRAAAILWLLAERQTWLNLSEIARAIDILPSTALHILRELTVARLIEMDESKKRYGLGHGLVAMAGAVNKRDRFVEISTPYLREIVDRFGVTATATALIDQEHTACVISISPPSDMSLNVTLGGRVPRLAGAAGRCIAAHMKAPAAELRHEFQRIHWQAPLDFDCWLDEVDQVRSRGFAEDDGRFSLGIITLAAGVLSADGSIAGVIGTVSISATLADDLKSEIADALIIAARLIGDSLNTNHSKHIIF